MFSVPGGDPPKRGPAAQNILSLTPFQIVLIPIQNNINDGESNLTSVILITRIDDAFFMSQDIFCKKCGATLDSYSAFCPKCGTPVGVQNPAGAPAPEWVAKKEDKSGPFIGGSILIWLGLSLFLAQSGTISWAIWWAYFMVGLGAILIAFGFIRKRIGATPQDASGMVTGGLVVSMIGIFFVIASIINFGAMWPFLLVAIGLIIIVVALVSGKILR